MVFTDLQYPAISYILNLVLQSRTLSYIFINFAIKGYYIVLHLLIHTFWNIFNPPTAYLSPIIHTKILGILENKNPDFFSLNGSCVLHFSLDIVYWERWLGPVRKSNFLGEKLTCRCNLLAWAARILYM